LFFGQAEIHGRASGVSRKRLASRILCHPAYWIKAARSRRVPFRGRAATAIQSTIMETSAEYNMLVFNKLKHY
jgi:hypothetical protein